MIDYLLMRWSLKKNLKTPNDKIDFERNGLVARAKKDRILVEHEH